MNDARDRFDELFEALRAEEGGAPSFDPQLEQRLMNRFSHSQPASRMSRSSALIVGLSIFVVGGVALAATGGVTKLKNWILNVEVNGQPMEVALDENGESTFTVDTESGPATVHLQRSNSPEDGTMTTIQVVKGGGNEYTEDVAKVRSGPAAGVPETYTVKDLGDAQPFDAWVDEYGITNEIYVLDAREGAGSDVFLLTEVDGADTVVELVARSPMPIIADNLTTDIDIADDGTVTIRLEDERGQVREMQMRMRRNADDLQDAMQRRLEVATPDGEVTISVDAEDK